MESTLPIEDLDRQLRKRFPSARIQLDRPKKRSGVWFLDVSHEGHPAVIQWQQGKVFGVSSSASSTYGESADETYPDVESTYSRIVSLLLSRNFTSLPEPVHLSELRKAQGISQSELAEILKKQQGEVSKIERRHDVKLSTLRDYVKSVGGTLEILVRLPGGKLQPIAIEEEEEKEPRSAGKKALSAVR